MSPRDSEFSKFEPLRAYLAGRPRQQYHVTLTFAEIEKLLGEPLPEAAYAWESGWWRNYEDGSNPPQSRAWLEAGFGVSSVAYPTATSGSVNFFRGLHRWPGVGVSSWEFGKLPIDERLHQLALGYLRSAKILCIGLGEDPSELNWPRAAVVCFCYRHAVELFLKSCILHREPLEKCDHDISKLRKQYFRLYPYQEFYFKTIYDISLQEVEELLGGRADIEDFERKDDQVYRYLSDKQGRSPKGGHMFAPGGELSVIERLEDDISRIWDRIRELDGRTEPEVTVDGGEAS
jgi:hypothetical protein